MFSIKMCDCYGLRLCYLTRISADYYSIYTDLTTRCSTVTLLCTLPEIHAF